MGRAGVAVTGVVVVVGALGVGSATGVGFRDASDTP